jgi:hypothetical protein
VTRYVSKGFTRGNVLLDEISRDEPSNFEVGKEGKEEHNRLFVDFENENLNAILKVEGKEDKLLAICPDLITVRYFLFLSYDCSLRLQWSRC